ncbi:hypothetical protein HWV07_08575 [Natronomonas salina]|uniref:DUF7344 domain-containing protein n=1 Tax=Natronomonas salina TaxID=1710540 RepID=UPI0015B4A79E|nr:hypothetical protein [Natronomonas salina]QLD89081.1 hypothetical protein HWV07_08575 [Natronomonas salina]
MVSRQQFAEHPPAPVDDLSRDTVLRLISQPMRRALLACLDQRDVPLAVADVSKEIVQRTRDNPGDEVTENEAEHCYLSLYHRDIPKLADYGIVTMNYEENTVELTARGEALVRNQDELLTQML